MDIFVVFVKGVDLDCVLTECFETRKIQFFMHQSLILFNKLQSHLSYILNCTTIIILRNCIISQSGPIFQIIVGDFNGYA